MAEITVDIEVYDVDIKAIGEAKTQEERNDIMREYVECASLNIENDLIDAIVEKYGFKEFD
jgi:hypothetical protein